GHSVPLAERPGFAVLAPTDMVLHSAAHLFDEGEFARGLRDLDDLSQLLRHFGRDPKFFAALVERSAELDLRRPLFYALRYTAAILGVAVPRSIAAADRLNPPGVAVRALMDFLFDRALRPDHPDHRDLFGGAALRLLYIRAHWLRMPPHILIPHLI